MGFSYGGVTFLTSKPWMHRTGHFRCSAGSLNYCNWYNTPKKEMGGWVGVGGRHRELENPHINWVKGPVLVVGGGGEESCDMARGHDQTVWHMVITQLLSVQFIYHKAVSMNVGVSQTYRRYFSFPVDSHSPVNALGACFGCVCVQRLVTNTSSLW